MTTSTEEEFDLHAAARSYRLKTSESSFEEFIERAFPGFNWYRYNRTVVRRFDDLVAGKLKLPDGAIADQIFVHLRYQTGKSTIAQLFAAYLLTRFPGIRIGSAMHRKDQTEDFSRAVQSFYRQAGGTLRSFAVHNWSCAGDSDDTRSRFWALSKGSSPTGKPADVLFADDLLGGAADAASRGQFIKDKQWFVREFRSRERVHKHPRLGRFLAVLINTRQSLGDIASYWLYLGSWYCIIYPTVYDPEKWPIGVPVGPFPSGDGDTGLPERTVEAPNCTIEPDWREIGEGLEPSVPMLTAEAFHARRAVNGGYQSEMDCAANEQGCPKPASGGGIFHRSWITAVSAPARDRFVAVARTWDIAATEGGGDWTASVLMGLTLEGKIVVLHGCRARKDAAGVFQFIAAMAMVDGHETLVGLPVAQGEGKLTFAGLVKNLRSKLVEFGVPAPPIRAMPVKTKTHGDEFRSAKHYRFAHHGGSFAQVAQPPDWDWKTQTSDMEGGVQIAKDWPLNAVLPQHVDLPIRQLALAACGRLDVVETLALNVCPGPWGRVAVDEWHDFSGFDGGSDNYVDAAADGKRILSAGFSKPMTI